MKSHLVCVLLFCFIFFSTSVSFADDQADTKNIFVFTAIPDQDESQLRTRFDKVAKYLQTRLRLDVQYVPVKSYSAAVSAFRNNQVQLAWFGGLSGVKARMLVPHSEAIAQGYEDQFFKTYIIANVSTGLKKQEQISSAMAGRSFTFGSKGSTSGRLMPEYYLREFFNKTPDDIFSKVGFSGDHSRTIELVQAGAYDLGAVNYKVWDRALDEGKIDLTKVQVVWETPYYPDYQWTVRGDVDQVWGEGFSKNLTEALLTMNDPDLLAAFPREKFVVSNNEQYKVIEDTARHIGLLE